MSPMLGLFVSALEKDFAMSVHLSSAMRSYLGLFRWRIWIWLYRQVAGRSRQILQAQISHMRE